MRIQTCTDECQSNFEATKSDFVILRLKFISLKVGIHTLEKSIVQVIFGVLSRPGWWEKLAQLFRMYVYTKVLQYIKIRRETSLAYLKQHNTTFSHQTFIFATIVINSKGMYSIRE